MTASGAGDDPCAGQWPRSSGRTLPIRGARLQPGRLIVTRSAQPRARIFATMDVASPPATEPGFDADGPSLTDTVETELLRRLKQIAKGTTGRVVRLGSGDDETVWWPAHGAQV